MEISHACAPIGRPLGDDRRARGELRPTRRRRARRLRRTRRGRCVPERPARHRRRVPVAFGGRDRAPRRAARRSACRAPPATRWCSAGAGAGGAGVRRRALPDVPRCASSTKVSSVSSHEKRRRKPAEARTRVEEARGLDVRVATVRAEATLRGAEQIVRAKRDVCPPLRARGRVGGVPASCRLRETRHGMGLRWVRRRGRRDSVRRRLGVRRRLRDVARGGGGVGGGLARSRASRTPARSCAWTRSWTSSRTSTAAQNRRRRLDDGGARRRRQREDAERLVDVFVSRRDVARSLRRDSGGVRAQATRDVRGGAVRRARAVPGRHTGRARRRALNLGEASALDTAPRRRAQSFLKLPLTQG